MGDPPRRVISRCPERIALGAGASREPQLDHLGHAAQPVHELQMAGRRVAEPEPQRDPIPAAIEAEGTVLVVTVRERLVDELQERRAVMCGDLVLHDAALPAHAPLDLSERAHCHERDHRPGSGEAVAPRGSGEAERSVHPHERRRCETAHVSAVLEDDAGAEEAEAGGHVGCDAQFTSGAFANVVAGTSTNGFAWVSGAGAAPGGVTVTLSSSNPAIATVSPSVLTIPQGAASARFTVSTAPESAPVSVNISATDGTTISGQGLVIWPPDSVSVKLAQYDKDPVEPRLEGSAPLEAVEAVEHGHPGVLHDLLREGLVVDEDAREPQQPSTVATDEAGERGAVSRPDAPDELGVVDARDGRSGQGAGRLARAPHPEAPDVLRFHRRPLR